MNAPRPLSELPLLGGAERLFGHTRAIARDRHAVLRRLVAESRTARCLRFRTLGPDAVLVNAPEPLQGVLVEKAKSFEKSLVLKFALEPLGGQGLFTSDGALWRRQRRLMAPLFHREQLEAYAAAMVAVTERAMASWGAGGLRAIHRDTTQITMAVAGKTLFDADTFAEADTLGAALTDALAWTSENAPSALSLAHLFGGRALQRLGDRLGDRGATLTRAGQRLIAGPILTPGPSGRRLRAALALLDARVQRMIEERRAAPARVPGDLLDRLLEARDDREAMSDRQVRDEILTLFVAGHETTASGLAWVLTLLCQHPDVHAAVVAEVDALDGPPTFSDLPRLALTLRVFKEALRLYPPVFLYGRAALEPVVIDGWQLPRDTPILIAPWALHRREDLWPDPERFDPDRFLPERESAAHKLAWIPFGAGPRVCIGNHFAMMEAQLVLATLLRRYRFAPGDGPTTPEFGATLRPSEELTLRVTAR